MNSPKQITRKQVAIIYDDLKPILKTLEEKLNIEILIHTKLDKLESSPELIIKLIIKNK